MGGGGIGGVERVMDWRGGEGGKIAVGNWVLDGVRMRTLVGGAEVRVGVVVRVEVRGEVSVVRVEVGVR